MGAITGDGVFELLKQTTSISVVAAALKERHLPFSAASWDDLYNLRIAPALARGELTLPDLISILREAGENSRQHVFLYHTSAARARELLEPSRVSQVLKEIGLGTLLKGSKLLDAAGGLKVVDVLATEKSLSITLVEERFAQTLVNESRENGRVIKEYEEVVQRAVSTVKLDATGGLQVRIASRSTYGSYLPEVNEIFVKIGTLVPAADFKPVSLERAKRKLFDERESLKGKVRYSDSTLRNAKGTVLRAATGAGNADLFTDKAALASLTNFMNDDGHCEASGIWFEPNGEDIARALHVLVSGESNEYAVTSHCKSNEHEYVLRELRSLNR